MEKLSISNANWLATGDYQIVVDALTALDPRLRRRDPKAVSRRIPYEDRGAHVALLEAVPGSRTMRRTRDFDDAHDLALHLEARAAADAQAAAAARMAGRAGMTEPVMAEALATRRTGQRRVYVLEGLGPGFVGALGRHFGLHPAVFAEHERVVVHNQTHAGESDGLPLPSCQRSRRHLALKYFEVMAFSEAPRSFRWVCADTGRHVGVSRDLRWETNQKDDIDRFLDVGIVRRKCCIWYTGREDGGWDCLVLCDPPVRRIRTGDRYSEEFPVKTYPYQGGYVDFVPEAEQLRARATGGPPRTSMLEDLAYYLETHGGLVDLAGASAVSVFIEKIIASHYLRHTEHLRALLAGVQRGLARKQDLKRIPMSKIEALWSDLQVWERRMGEYCEDLESIMLQLGIPLVAPPSAAHGHNSSRLHSHHPLGVVGSDLAAEDEEEEEEEQKHHHWWQDSTADYQFLHQRFRELRHRTASLNAAVTGLASITGNRLSMREQQRGLREAKSNKAVTLLGLLFIPLAYTASLFSMSAPYAPGDTGFYVYFATSLPLIILVLLGYYVLDFGYDGTGTAWSASTFRESVRKRWEILRERRGREASSMT